MAKAKTIENKNSLKPSAGFLLIEPETFEKRTASGIVLPDSHEEKPQMGKVLAVGPVEVTDFGIQKESPCQIGQTVIYKQWGGNEIKIEGKEYLIVKFEDILAIKE